VIDSGVYRGTLMTSVDYIPSERTNAVVLSPNYPNPFNPTTTIGYAIPKLAKVSLKVYDVLGREVLTLVDGLQEAGYHHVSLNATHFASGIYFYKITAGPFTDVKKLVVVR
jgi:hypothetical protein